MYDFLTQYPLYIVLLIVLIGWFGIFVYLMKLDRKVSRLEQHMKESR